MYGLKLNNGNIDEDLYGRKKILRFDFIVPLLALIISSFGLLIVYSATRSTLPGGVIDPQYYLKRQAIFISAGVFIFIIMQFINYRKLKNFWWVSFALGIIMLVSVLIFGYEVNSSKSWIDLKLSPVQPSEFGKVFMIITIAAILSKWKREKVNFVSFKKVVFSLLSFVIFIFLIILEPDFGTAIIYFLIYIGMLFISGTNLIYPFTVIAMAAGGVFAALKIGIIKQYQLDRLLVFLKPEVSNEGAGYNLYQSKIAIGSGGLVGKGLFLGKQTNLSYVPEHHTDFIFSVIGEELGFIGGFLIIVILGILVWRCFYIAANSSDDFGMLLGAGVGMMILSQIVINIGMTIGIMPIIGIPLPFLSSGGSSLISMFFGISLVENVFIWKETRKEHEIAYQEYN